MTGIHSNIGGGVRADRRGVSGIRALDRFCPIAGPVGQRFSAIHGHRAGGQATSSVIGLVAAGKLTNKRSNGKCRFKEIAATVRVRRVPTALFTHVPYIVSRTTFCLCGSSGHSTSSHCL